MVIRGPKPVRPIVIVGTGRCGSTMLHRLLALHEDVGWLSTFNEVLPTQAWLSTFSGLYRLGLPSSIRHWRGFPKPYEAYRFWEHYLPGFSRRDRPQTADDLRPEWLAPVRRATDRVLAFQRGGRLLVKVTGWSRIAYFDRIYPDALFIALHRDSRSVVSSWIKAGWLDVTSAPDSDDWQWGPVPNAYLEQWEALGGGPLLSVALKIRLDLDDIAANMALFPARCHELSYEDLIREPQRTLSDLCEFAGLDYSPRFAQRVRATEFRDPTEKWKAHLSESEGERVLEFLRRTEGADGARVVSASPAP